MVTPSAYRFAGARVGIPWFALVMGIGLVVSRIQAQGPGYPIVASFSAAQIDAAATSWVTVQDADGVLYFGGDRLLTFDGERWRNAPLNGAYALRSLDFGPAGRLWAAAEGEIGWFQRAVEGWQFHSLRPYLPAGEQTLGGVWHVFSEGAGALFVSEDKILRWDGKSFRVWPMPGARRLHAFRIDRTIYVQHPPSGLYALRESGPELLIPASVLGEAGLFRMERSGAGWLFVAGDGLFNYAQGKRVPFGEAAGEFVRREAITCATRLGDGRLVVGTVRGGIAVIRPDGSLESNVREADGLPANLVRSLFVGRDGELWVGSRSHISRIDLDSRSRLFDRRANLPDQPSVAIVRHNGRITIANESGAYELQEDNRQFSWLDTVREPLRDIRASPDGLLTAGIHALKRISAGQTAVLHSTPSDVFAISESWSRPGEILISEGRSVVGVKRDGTARVLVRDVPDIVTSIAEDETRGLWLGSTLRGVLWARPTESTAVASVSPLGSGLPEIPGEAVVTGGPTKAVLVLSSGGGWVKSGGSERFQAIAGFPQRAVAAVTAIDADGTAWVVHAAFKELAASVARISIRGDRAVWAPHSVTGLWSIGTPQSIFAEPSLNAARTLWIGGATGVLRHDIPAGLSAPRPPPPLLRVAARNAQDDLPQAITSPLPYATRSIEFEFAAPAFTQRAQLRLETRIDGIDRDWVPAGPDARRELTAVREGRYTFRVRAVAETGVPGEPTVFSFQVAPPWWRTWPAILGLGLTLLPVGYGSYHLRLRALHRRNAELEQKVRERTEQLEQASAAKTQFVANMSHDIRNPLNGIVGLALALEDSRLDPKQQELVATLRECTTYLSSLVDDVLDFASIEAGRVELRPGPFVPIELLRSIVTTLESDIAQSGATLVVTVDPALPPSLLSDAGRIQQILVNYVSNALKYAGGEIRLSASVPADAPDEVEFAVVDFGPGIGEIEQGTLFTKFTRLVQARHHDIPGAGLGLASCRLLADLMGGSVGVTSRPGDGARFFLRLPFTAAAAPVAPVNGPLPNTTVLLVEDTDYNALAAAAVLSRLGLSCERAHTGAEALQLFAAKRFNLVLLDRNLPDMDGTEVARRMRACETDGLQAIILAVTAYCTADDRKLCLAAGMDAFVGKPLTPEKLRKVLLAAGRRLLTAATVDASVEKPPRDGLDTSLLDYLADGTERGLAVQLERFLDSLAGMEAALAQAIAANDMAEIGVSAHRIHGQARMVGSVALQEAAAQLEQAARAGDHAGCGNQLPKVTGEIRVLRAALRRRRSGALTR